MFKLKQSSMPFLYLILPLILPFKADFLLRGLNIALNYCHFAPPRPSNLMIDTLLALTTYQVVWARGYYLLF
jgi:hypothetical protein